MKQNYHPNDFEEPTSYQHYVDTLGKAEFEIIATHIIRVSQIEGKWTPVNSFPETLFSNNTELNHRLKQMVKCGHLDKTDDGFTLPQETLEMIAKKYSIRK
ncbi:hypothetical protein HY485_04060 [Candidatus Woesearchaeota archaeon]|nr:hypothetical protein [Candidatus Woesearchaeota archaeon]